MRACSRQRVNVKEPRAGSDLAAELTSRRGRVCGHLSEYNESPGFNTCFVDSFVRIGIGMKPESSNFINNFFFAFTKFR